MTNRDFDTAIQAGQLVADGYGEAGQGVLARAVEAHRGQNLLGPVPGHAVDVYYVARDAVLPHEPSGLPYADGRRQNVHVQDLTVGLGFAVCSSPTM